MAESLGFPLDIVALFALYLFSRIFLYYQIIMKFIVKDDNNIIPYNLFLRLFLLKIYFNIFFTIKFFFTLFFIMHKIYLLYCTHLCMNKHYLPKTKNILHKVYSDYFMYTATYI